MVHPPFNSTNSSIQYDGGPYIELLRDGIHWWFFTVHYLSICGGYVGGTENREYGFLGCEQRAAGWRFRTDDPFIVNFLSIDGSFPVDSAAPFETFTTAPAFGTLAVGISFSVFSVGTLAADAFGGWSKFGRLAQASV